MSKIEHDVDIDMLEVEAAARGIANIQTYFNLSINEIADGAIYNKDSGMIIS